MREIGFQRFPFMIHQARQKIVTLTADVATPAYG